MTILFWNVNRRNRLESATRLTRLHKADILILAESAVPEGDLVHALQQVTPTFRRVLHVSGKIDLYTRLSPTTLTPVLEEKRLLVCRLLLQQEPACLLAAVHFPSKLFWSAASQSAECEVLARSLWEEEKTLGRRRTILLGDLNMDPFEEGIVKANGLHAVTTRRLALREARTVQRRTYPFFFNPMWGLYGEGHGRSGGTYYYETAEHVAHFWHMYDQVLVRPALLPFLANDGVQILTEDGTISFLSSAGIPDAGRASDHLPILVRLSLESKGGDNVSTNP